MRIVKSHVTILRSPAEKMVPGRPVTGPGDEIKAADKHPD